ncbi:hypothetical protein [Bacillus cereus]
MRDIKVKDSYGDDITLSQGYTPEDLPAVHVDYDGDRAYGLNEIDQLIEGLQEWKAYLEEAN